MVYQTDNMQLHIEHIPGVAIDDVDGCGDAATYVNNWLVEGISDSILMGVTLDGDMAVQLKPVMIIYNEVFHMTM